jgi:hypothetical protein
MELLEKLVGDSNPNIEPYSERFLEKFPLSVIRAGVVTGSAGLAGGPRRHGIIQRLPCCVV